MNFSDQELIDLKSRVLQAIGSNVNIGNANDYLLKLIEEIQEHRKTPSVPRGVLRISSMDVKKVGLPLPTLEVKKEKDGLFEIDPSNTDEKKSISPSFEVKGGSLFEVDLSNTDEKKQDSSKMVLRMSRRGPKKTFNDGNAS
jgi:hypothetical protein